MRDGSSFQIDFDFIDHRLIIAVSDGRVETLPLAPCSVAEFYRNVMDRLKALGLEIRIWTVPVELPDPIRFDQDHTHAAYVMQAGRTGSGKFSSGWIGC
jgi:hypothetical protein